jgi:hypothetical protein
MDRLWARRSRPQAQRTERRFGGTTRGQNGAARRIRAHGSKGGPRFRSAAPRTYGCWEWGDGEAASALAAYGRWRESCWLGPEGLLDLIGQEHWPAMYTAEEPLRGCETQPRPHFSFCIFVPIKDTHLDDSETRKPPNINTEAAHIVVLHPFEDRLSRSHP